MSRCKFIKAQTEDKARKAQHDRSDTLSQNLQVNDNDFPLSPCLSSDLNVRPFLSVDLAEALD